MKPRINYRYNIPFKDVCCFKFQRYGVDETCYEGRIEPRLPHIIEVLKQNPNSRQAVIVTNNNENNACLVSLQFQVIRKKLLVSANFRSQCKVNGRPVDTIMLQWIANVVRIKLGLKKFKISVIVGNYHVNKELIEINRKDAEVQKNLQWLKSKTH